MFVGRKIFGDSFDDLARKLNDPYRVALLRPTKLNFEVHYGSRVSVHEAFTMNGLADFLYNNKPEFKGEWFPVPNPPGISKYAQCFRVVRKIHDCEVEKFLKIVPRLN